jgi:alpha-tubulin suppressor-like RCC1 family protein
VVKRDVRLRLIVVAVVGALVVAAGGSARSAVRPIKLFEAVTVSQGSSTQHVFPEPLVDVQGAALTRGDAARRGLDVTVPDGRIVIDAGAHARTGRALAVIEGVGCTAVACDQKFVLELAVKVREPAARADEPLEVVEPSSDRIAAGTQVGYGGIRLDDELLVTIGTDDDRGSRGDAERLAASVGAVVTGGIEALGFYQFRWHSSQDVDARRAQLEAQPEIASAGVAHLGLARSEREPGREWQPDVLRETLKTPPDEEVDDEAVTWPFTMIRAPEAWETTTGGDVTVGIVDEGSVFGGHLDLNVAATVNSYPDGDHATHVAGLACAEQNDRGVVGVAWGCPIISGAAGKLPLGGVFEASVLEAASSVAWLGAAMINISLGYPAGGCGDDDDARELQALADETKLVDDFERLYADFADVLWTFSAGNNCMNGVQSPWKLAGAGRDNVIIVAAVNENRRLASFSNFGLGVDVAAPGGHRVVGDKWSGIWSTIKNSGLIPCLAILGDVCSDWARTVESADAVGTSMAAPIVAGVAALVRSAQPTFSAAGVKRCIIESAAASPVVAPADDPAPWTPHSLMVYEGGLGIVDAAAAVRCALEPPPLQVTAISGGGRHTCALHDGGAKCWGGNGSGALGDGTNVDRLTPVDVSTLTGGITAISAGWLHTCALSSGGVKCWGSNASGALGDDSVIHRLTPVNVVGLGDAAAVSAGGSHTCATRSEGAVACWGNNNFGQLGDGTRTDRRVPVHVVGLGGRATAITSGNGHTCALLADGVVKCWGVNASGQLGDGTLTTFRVTPVEVVGLGAAVAAISARGDHTCARLVSGGVKCWGSNAFGELGDGTRTARPTAVDVFGLDSGVTAISLGWSHTCALLTAGGVKCWGENIAGQLGDGTPTPLRLTPVGVAGLATGVVRVSAGDYHTCALLIGGGVKCWGGNGEGQLGDSTRTNRLAPVDVVGLG